MIAGGRIDEDVEILATLRKILDDAATEPNPRHLLCVRMHIKQALHLVQQFEAIGRRRWRLGREIRRREHTRLATLAAGRSQAGT